MNRFFKGYKAPLGRLTLASVSESKKEDVKIIIGDQIRFEQMLLLKRTYKVPIRSFTAV
jgi:hypothetical protein